MDIWLWANTEAKRKNPPIASAYGTDTFSESMLLEAECAPVVSIWDSLAMLRQTPDAKEKEILEMDVVEEIKKMGQIHNDIHSLLWKASLSLFGSIFRGFGIKHSSCKVKRKQVTQCCLRMR